MNDRFKFRVWNKEDETYEETTSFDCVRIDNDGQLRIHNYSDASETIEDYTDSYIIEQCTGLRDKNGNLIYEGDIVIGRKEIVVCEMIEYKDVVEYKDGAYFPFNWTGVYKSEKFEIIGNIHEQKDNK